MPIESWELIPKHAKAVIVTEPSTKNRFRLFLGVDLSQVDVVETDTEQTEEIIPLPAVGLIYDRRITESWSVGGAIFSTSLVGGTIGYEW